MTAFPPGSKLGSISQRDLIFQDGWDGGLWWLGTISRGRAGQIPSGMSVGGRRPLLTLEAGVSGTPARRGESLAAEQDQIALALCVVIKAQRNPAAADWRLLEQPQLLNLLFLRK